jgi:hypothetical protein
LQLSSANGFYSYTILPPPAVPPLVPHLQVQGPFAPEKTKPEAFNVFLEPAASASNSSTVNSNSTAATGNVSSSSHEQQQQVPGVNVKIIRKS